MLFISLAVAVGCKVKGICVHVLVDVNVAVVEASVLPLEERRDIAIVEEMAVEGGEGKR